MLLLFFHVVCFLDIGHGGFYVCETRVLYSMTEIPQFSFKFTTRTKRGFKLGMPSKDVRLYRSIQRAGETVCFVALLWWNIGTKVLKLLPSHNKCRESLIPLPVFYLQLGITTTTLGLVFSS